jgi:hypothetical protein
MPEIGMSVSMSRDGKRSAGHRPQATAPILDSTIAGRRSDSQPLSGHCGHEAIFVASWLWLPRLRSHVDCPIPVTSNRAAGYQPRESAVWGLRHERTASRCSRARTLVRLFTQRGSVYDHALTRLCTVTRGYVKNPDPQPQWPEFICAEGNGHVAIRQGEAFPFGRRPVDALARGPRAARRALFHQGEEIESVGRFR